MSATKKYIDEMVERGELNPRTLEPYAGQEQEEQFFYRNEEEEMMMYFYFLEMEQERQQEDVRNGR